jgi:hypothetical protein
LDVQVLALFKETEHELLMQQIESLKLQDLPALAYTNRNHWLGDKPTLY